jgi:hypothetical protein
MLDIEGNGLAQARKLFRESVNGAREKSLQQGLIEVAQFLTQPILTGHGFLPIETRGSARIEEERKAEFDDQKWMPDQKATQLSGRKHALADADEESFEKGALRMGRASTKGRFGLPLVNHL